MATAFNLTAQLNLRGPSNVNKIVADIKKQLSGITANVNMKLDPNVAKNVKALDASLKSLNATLAKTSTNATSAASAMSAFGKAVNAVSMKNIPSQINATVSSMNKLNKSSSNIGGSLAESATEMQEFGKQAGLAIRRFAAFSAVTGVIYSLSNSITQGVQAFIEYDRELVRLQQVTGQTAGGLQNLQKSISALATGLGVSSKELTTVSVTLAQAGLNAKDTERALRALALSSLAPSFDDMNETVEGSIALMRQFGISAGQLEQALGSINSVAAAFAVEADDLITAIQRTGGVFATASKGVSEGTDALNEFISVFTSVRATTRESAETIATGLRTIFTRIQRGATIDALKEFGVTLTDSEGKFVGAYKAVQLLSEGLSKLDPRDIKFSRIVEELGGFRQIGKVIPLIQQFSVAQEALKIAQGGQASLAKDAATAQLSLANQIQKVREEFFALFREIGQSKGFQSLVTGVLTLTRGLIKLADVSKSLLPALSVIMAFKGASALTQFASGFSQGFRPGGGKNDKERPRFNNGGRVKYFATGGSVPGGGSADNVPAMLTPGEFVINKKAASKIGRRTLHKMNRYAGGGSIRAGISDIEIQEVEDGDTFTASVIPNTEPFSARFRMGSYDAYETGNKRSRITNSRLDQIKKYNTRSGALDEIDETSNPIAIPSYTRVKKGTTASEAAEEGKSILSNKLSSVPKTSLIKKINQTLDVEGGFGRYLADLGKILPDELTTGRTWKNDTKNLGGLIKKFASGGVATRKVGYIDYDVIANDANKDIVEKGMKTTGASGPRLYTDYLTDLAVKARKNSNLQKLRAIYGVAGSGKTTLARGQGTDNAALRQTERFPVLSPEDIEKATEILVLSSSVSKKKLDEMFSATDRTYTLSSTTKADKERVRSQRAARDTTGVGLEGRKPGSTTGVATDTAVGEALLTDALGNKSVVLGRNNRGGLRRKQGNELVDIIKKKIGFTWGGFAPMTAGHESIMDAAAAMGYSPEDFIYLVGANEGIKAGDPSSYRTAVFDQDFRVLLAKAGAGARGARVLPKPRDFEVPQAFDISDDTDSRRRVLIPGKGSRAFVADKTEEQTAKYKEAGYGVTNLERTGGISGTMVRELIMSGNMKKLQDVLSPGVYELISNNIGRLQNRANALPDIIEQVRQTQGVQLADVEKQIKTLGISRIDNKKIDSDPEYAAKVAVLQELRGRRDKIKSAASFEPYRLLDMMAQKEPDQYGLDLTTLGDVKPIRTVSPVQKAAIGGLIRKFSDAGVVSPTSGKPASRSEILKVLTKEEAGKAAGISGFEIYDLLGLRNPDAQQQAMRDAIQKEYIKKLNRKSGAAKGVTTRLQNKGFEFGAAGMFGKAFAAENMDIESERLSRSAKVRVVSGVMKKEVADKLDSIFATGTDELVRKGAEAVQQGYGQNDPLSALFSNPNADASIGGGLLEKVIQSLGGPGTVKGKGFDFPDGLKGAAKYFSLPPDIPTDVKRTLDGASTIKDNIVTYLKNVAGYADGGKVSLDDVRKKIADQYPDYKFRINPKSSGFGYRMLARPAAKDAPESLMAFDLVSRLSDAPNTAKELINRIKEQEESKKFAGGGPVTLYHGSNTGVNDSVLESFKKEGAKPDIAQGYGQGAGFYVYSGKEKAKQQAMMRVKKGLGSFAVVSGDTEGKPMVVTFKESLDPATWDLDYELNKGPVVQWLYDNYAAIKDKTAPKITKDEQLTGIRGVVDKDTANGIMSAGIQVQSNMGSRKTIYAGDDSDIREGELVGQIMNRLQKQDPAMVAGFENQFFKSPALASGDWDNLALKYVGSSPLQPTNIETFMTGGKILPFANGGMVPALLTPGEAVIPPSMAKKIGYSKLSRMNRADRNGMARYASGGGVGIVPGSGNTDSFGPVPLPVGSFVIRKKATEALGFNSGGKIPRFASGGDVGADITRQIMSWLSSDMVASRKPQMASRPDVVSRGTVTVSDETTKSLDILVKALNQLGLSASSSAEILNKGGEVSYKTIEKALVKDIERLKISNAGIDSIVAAETTLANIRKKSKEDVGKQKNLQGMTNRRGNSATQILGGMTVGDLKGGSGAGQQAIDTQAKMIAEEKIKARGGKVSEKQRSKIMESSYVEAASKVTGIKKSDFKSAGISGSDIQKYIAESMKDRKTLSQMDKQLIALRLEEYHNAGTVRGIAVKSAKEAEALAQEEVSTRRKIINDLAAQQGEKGVGAAGMFDFNNSPILNQIKDFMKSPGRVMGGISTVAGLAAGSSDLIAKQMYDTTNVGGKKKAAAAGAGIQSAGTILSTGMAAASQMAAIPVVGPYVAGITAVGTAALAAADYFGDFTGAQKEAVRALESELRAKEIGQATDDLDNAFQKFEADMANIDLQEALNQALSRAVTLQTRDTTANIDQAQEDYAKNNRSWMGYFMGEKPVMGAPERNEVNRAEAAKYSQFADKGYAQIQSEINRGSSLDQIMSNEKLAGARRAIALSDASGVNQFYSQSQAEKKSKGRDLTDSESQAIIDQIAATKIESDEKIKAAIKTKQLSDAMEAANRAGRRLADSFQEITSTIDQAINRVQKESKIRQAQANSLVEARRGNAGFDEAAVDNKNIGVLTDPKAYKNDPGRVDAAIRDATSGMSPELAQKMSGGARLEASLPSVMRNAINDSLKNNAGASLDEVSEDAKKRGIAAIKASGLSEDDQKVAIDKLETTINRQKDQAQKENTDPRMQVDAFADSISELGPEIAKMFGNAGQALDKIISQRQNIYNTFAKNLETASEAARKARDSFNKARDIRYNAKMDLREAQTGVKESYDEAKAKFDDDIKRLTGGPADPQAIGKNIDTLTQQREQQIKDRDAALSNPNLTQDQKNSEATKFAKDIQATNNALNDNREALDKMANSAELAQKALDEVKNVKGLQQDRENFVNQLLTNTPEEADKLNQTFIRLQRNLSGGLNNPSNQRDAQNAFKDTLRRTGNVREATRAGNTVLADQRKQTLQLMQDPGFRGMMTLNMKNQGMSDDQIDKNFRYQEGMLMQQMAVESGMINNPMVQQALAAKQNPNADPAMKKAADQFLQSTGLMAKATEEQGRLELANVQTLLATATDDLRTSIDTLTQTINAAMGSGGEGEKIPGLGGDKVALNLGVKGSVGVPMLASKGRYVDFQPKGTDTIPAMLTRGEFVVNAKSTAQNRGLLEDINDGKALQYAARGGLIRPKYLAGGGPVNPDELAQLEQARTDAQQTSWMMSEATGASPNEVVDRSASSWTESQVGYGKWQGMTDDQRQAEIDKNKPIFQQKWDSYQERQTAAQDESATKAGYSGSKDDPNAGIVGVHFFHQEKAKAKADFDKAQTDYETAKDQSVVQQPPAPVNMPVYGPSLPLSSTTASVGSTSTNQIMGGVAAGVDPRTIAAQQSASPILAQFQETDAQRYMRMAQEAGPKSMADFRKPKNAGEVGMYKEGLARGMTIDEIKYERQQAYLSRFNPQTRKIQEKKLGKSLISPSTRISLYQQANTAQQQAMMGNDPYANQRVAIDVAESQNKFNSIIQQGLGTPQDRAQANKAIQDATKPITANEPLPIETQAVTEPTTLQSTKQDMQTSTNQTASPISQKKAELIAGIYNGMIPKPEDAPQEGDRNSLRTLSKLRAQKSAADNWYQNALTMSEEELEKIEASRTPAAQPTPPTSASQPADAQAKANSEAAARAAEQEAQKAAQQAAADAEKKRQEGMWVNSSNPLWAGLGYLGGVTQAAGDMAYGAANVAAGATVAAVGAVASPLIDDITGQAAANARAAKLDQQIKDNQRKQSEAGVLGEDLATAQSRVEDKGPTAAQAFRNVGLEAAAQGAYTAVEFGQAIAGQGPAQTGEQSWLHQGDDKRVEMAGDLGGATRVFQNIGYAASQAAPALAGTAATTGASPLTRAAQFFGRLDDITMSPLTKAFSATGKGLGKVVNYAADTIGDTAFGQGVRTVTNAMGDTIRSFNPLVSKTERGFIKQNMDAAYGVQKSSRYSRLTGGDPTQASSVLRSRAARLDALKEARASGVKDSAISSRVEGRKLTRFLDDMDAQKAKDNVAFNNYNAAQARKNDPSRMARREKMKAEGLVRQKRVNRGLKRQEQFAAMTPEQRALARTQRRGLERGVDVGRSAREQAQIQAEAAKQSRIAATRAADKNQGRFTRYSYGKGPTAKADKAADRLRRRASQRGVNADTANQYAIDFGKTVDDSGQVVSESRGLSRLDDIQTQQQQLAATKAAEAQAKAQADDLRKTFGVGSARKSSPQGAKASDSDWRVTWNTPFREGGSSSTPTSRVMAAVDNQPKTAAQVASTIKEATSPNIAITRESLERNAQRTAQRQQALASGVDPKTGLKPGTVSPKPKAPVPAPASVTQKQFPGFFDPDYIVSPTAPIKTGVGTAQSTVDRVRTAQKTLKDRLANFTSSDEAAQRLQGSSDFDIDALIVDPKMRKRGASGVENTTALGRYFGGGQGKRTMQLKSNDIKSDVIEHELGHAFQHNTGKFGGARKQNKPGLMDRLLGRQGNNWNAAEQELMDTLGSDVKKFLKDPNGYDALRKSVKGDVSGMYPAQAVMDKPIELFTSLVQASRSGQFGSNTQAVEMLKKLMKFHGYADGGMVYANNGAKPKGADNIPAMLSRGEFVIKQKEAQKHMPLLEAINSGAYSRGGLVNYMANGGLVMPNYLQRGGQPSPVPAPAPLTGVSSSVGVDIGGLTSLVAGLQKTVNDLGASIPSMSQVAENINSAVGSFVSSGAQVGDMITNAINPVVQGLREVNIPDQITVAGTVDSKHTFNGAEAANNVLGALGPTMEQNTNQQIGKFAGAINRGIGNLGEGALGPDTGQIMGQIGGNNYGTA